MPIDLTPRRQRASPCLVGYSPDGSKIMFNDTNTWGFHVTWGLYINVEVKRSIFLTKWKSKGLPTKGIIARDFLEPTTRKRWATTAFLMRRTFESIRPDGTRIKLVRMGTNSYQIIRMVPNGNKIKTKRSTLVFDSKSPDGPFLFSKPERDADIATFVHEHYSRTLTHILTDEARKYIVDLLHAYCFACLEVQKGGMYYVDMKHAKFLKRIRRFLRAIDNRFGIDPILKTTGHGDVDFFPMLQGIMNYQLHRVFKARTDNIKRVLNANNVIAITLANKYKMILKSLIKELAYYATRFGLEDVLSELKIEAKMIKRQLHRKAESLDITAAIR